MHRAGMALALMGAMLIAVLPLNAHAEGRVILTVSGIHAETGDAVEVDLSLQNIAALESEVLRTTTLWTVGEIDFKGVRLEKLFALLNIVQPAHVRCTALNEYQIDLPMGDARKAKVLMAYAQNGAFMRIRDKGPLWIVYPRNSGILDAAQKMIWQLRRVEAVY